jgi:hypothetical protein
LWAGRVDGLLRSRRDAQANTDAVTGRPTREAEYALTKDEIGRIERYLRTLFGNAAIRLQPLSRRGESVEVYVGDESVGILTRDEEDEELTYHFHMAILAIDLE